MYMHIFIGAEENIFFKDLLLKKHIYNPFHVIATCVCKSTFLKKNLNFVNRHL